MFRAGARAWPAVAGLLILGVAWFAFAARVPPSTPEITSLAVLPISNAGADGDDVEFLAQGITESVIRRLSRLSKLRVIARDSVYRYAGQDVTARQVVAISVWRPF